MLAHAHRLVRSTAEGAAAFIDADIRNPDDILAGAAATLDLNQPVGLMLVAIVHALGDVGDHEDRCRIVSQLVDAVPSGSYLAMSHIASDIQAEETAEATRRLNEMSVESYVQCSTAEFAQFFESLELVGPGITLVGQWQPDEAEPSSPGVRVTPFHAAVGRKP